MKTKISLFAFLFSFSFSLYAQENQDSIPTQLTFSGYLEGYYTYDGLKPDNHQKAPFIYSHHRSNEFAVNLAMLRAQYTSKKVRANLSLAAGSYMNANYTSEEGVLKQIYESYAGVKLAKSSELWLDVGIMPSHIGPESAIGIDNLSLSRSLSAENSPYFETGAKLSYVTPNAKWNFAVLLLNGWQRIQLPASSRGPAFGHQIQYKPNANWLINSSSYMADEGSDSLRIFHDFYIQTSIHSKLILLANLDWGMQKSSYYSSKRYWWNSGIQAQYAIHPAVKINARYEYFSDADAVVLAGLPKDLKYIKGMSAGFDYKLFDAAYWRLEYRYLQSNTRVFLQSAETYQTKQHTISTALGIRF